MNNGQPTSDDIRRFRKGDREAFEKIYTYYYSFIYIFAKRIIKRHQEAQDIVAEVFLKLWKKRAKLKDDGNLKSFLWVITRNACFDYLRSIRRYSIVHGEIHYLSREEERLASLHSFDLALIEQEVIEILSQIESLPPRCKDVVKLIIFQGMKVLDIAKQLDISPGTVRYHRANAIKQLKNVLLKNNLLSAD